EKYTRNSAPVTVRAQPPPPQPQLDQVQPQLLVRVVRPPPAVATGRTNPSPPSAMGSQQVLFSPRGVASPSNSNDPTQQPYVDEDPVGMISVGAPLPAQRGQKK